MPDERAAIRIARTERLDIIPLSVAEAAHVFADARDPVLYRYLQAGPPDSLLELEKLYRRWTAGSHDPNVRWINGIVVARETAQRVGHVQATLDARLRSATIGYSTFRRFQRQGFAREALQALIDHLHERAGTQRVIAEISASNYASQAVAEALGFRVVGRIANAGRDNGAVCDDCVYALEVAAIAGAAAQCANKNHCACVSRSITT